MNFRGIAALFLSVWIAAPSDAAQFYYVSAPYSVSNYDTDTLPTLTTGMLDIDETKVSGGLANGEIRWGLPQTGSEGREYSWEEVHPAIRSMTFTNGIMDLGTIKPTHSTYGSILFDGDGQISSAGIDWGNEISESDSEDRYYQNYLNYDWAENGEDYEGKGRKGGHQSLGNEGGFSGFWTSDALAWAREIARRAAYAVTSPPSNACRVSALAVEDFSLPA